MCIKDNSKTLREAVVEPFHEFVTRGGWTKALLVLAFIFLYKLGDSMATSLATSFYLDLGFTKTQIGVVAKATSLWASVAGGIIGGIWLIKLGINRGVGGRSFKHPKPPTDRPGGISGGGGRFRKKIKLGSVHARTV